MTLQASGPIKASEIQTEFGGSNPISLSEYYGVDTVPASNTISFSDFYGTSNSDTTMDPLTFSNLGPASGSTQDTISGINATVSIRFVDVTFAGTIVVKHNGAVKTPGVAFNAVNGDTLRIEYTATGSQFPTGLNGSVSVDNLTTTQIGIGSCSVSKYDDEGGL